MELNLLYITIILVFIIDLTDFMDTVKKFILKKLYNIKNPDPSLISLKPFDCSLCAVWWASIIYIIIIQQLNIYSLFIVALFSLSTSFIGNIMQLIIDMINTIISKIYVKLK